MRRSYYVFAVAVLVAFGTTASAQIPITAGPAGTAQPAIADPTKDNSALRGTSATAPPAKGKQKDDLAAKKKAADQDAQNARNAKAAADQAAQNARNAKAAADKAAADARNAEQDYVKAVTTSVLDVVGTITGGSESDGTNVPKNAETQQ